VALPPEHGGWGLLFEPIIIGLVAAPSAAGALIALAAIGVFLSRQPLKIVLTDRAARRRVPRTRHAMGFAAAYLTMATLAAALAFLQVGAAPFMPVAFAGPLAVVQLVYDAQNRSRGLLPELCGAAALAVTASAIALADTWGLAPALALWAVAAARTMPAMVSVRTRVLRLHGERASGTAPLATHTIAVATVFVLQTAALVPRGVVTLLAILAARAGFTLRASAPRVRAQRIGIEELVIGLLASVLLGWLCRR
jgi:hypothetical protein